MNRHWFLTWTTYGNWLPGDPRGFVGDISDNSSDARRSRANVPHTPYMRDIPKLHIHAKKLMVSDPVLLAQHQAEEILSQFQETANYRGWFLYAVAIMSNHVHLVVGVPDDPDPDDLLRDFKSYASRRLNTKIGKRTRWWTERGSTRKLSNSNAVSAAIKYVENQHQPLVIWTNASDEIPSR